MPAYAATVLAVGGTGEWKGMNWSNVDGMLPGRFDGDDVVAVKYPAALIGMGDSISRGVDMLDGMIAETPGEKTVLGISQGAIVIAEEKRRLMALPPELRPVAGELTFVTLGDPSSPTGLLRWLPGQLPFISVGPVETVDTPYDTLTVNREYDGFADLPDRPLNLIATINAVMGIAYVHINYGGLDLSTVPAGNVTTVVNSLGGKTTTYLVPTARLPLLRPLRDVGVPEEIVRLLEEPLKRMVDAGYVRNDAPAVAPQVADSEPAAKAEPAKVEPAKVGNDADDDKVRESFKATPGDVDSSPQGDDDGKVRESFKAVPETEADPQEETGDSDTGSQLDGEPTNDASEGDAGGDSEGNADAA